MMTTDPVVRVRNLTKQYAGQAILAGIDLDIERGETYALLGPNGAGKSTTIEILEGFRSFDGGDVSVLGVKPLAAGRSWRTRLGIVAQATGDFGPYSPRELLGHFADLYAYPRGVDETLELVGLTDHADTRASKLSGGQQRRIDVALGIIGRPELLFLDEPTTGFDPEARRQFWGMLRGLQDDGTAIVLTTHYLDEAAQLADRVGVLNGGCIVAEAPPELLGGPGSRIPIVRWRDNAGVQHVQRTDRPAELVVRLQEETTAEFKGVGPGEPAALEVIRPSLEDIYLHLISEQGPRQSHKLEHER